MSTGHSFCKAEIALSYTFGSDLKYHVHVHCLVTFGGINANDEWCWPKRKKKIVPFRQMRRVFRTHFLSQLKKVYSDLKTREKFVELREDLLKKQWCVHAERPTTDTKIIEEYLGRYIPRNAARVMSHWAEQKENSL